MSATTKFVSFDEISNEMTDREYSLFSNRLERKGYKNDADRGCDGNPIDVDDIIIAGIDILNSFEAGE